MSQSNFNSIQTFADPSSDRQHFVLGVRVTVRFSCERNDQLPSLIKKLLSAAYLERIKAVGQ